MSEEARIEALAKDARTHIENADRSDEWKQGAREGVAWMERYVIARDEAPQDYGGAASPRTAKRRHVYVLEILSDGGNEIEVYARKADAQRRVSEITREARRNDDVDTHASFWKAWVR